MGNELPREPRRTVETALPLFAPLLTYEPPRADCPRCGTALETNFETGLSACPFDGWPANDY